MCEINAFVLDWLLEEESPGVRYLALRDLCDLPADDAQLLQAKEFAHQQGPIADVLNAMQPEGYWEKSGAGYLPKYRSTVWALSLLGQLGAHADLDPRIPHACNYFLNHAFCEDGQIGSSGTPSTTVDCLQGNMCAAMLDLGYEDERLEKAFDWLARSITGEGVAPLGAKGTSLRYYSGKIGPDFLCGANNKQPCAWGATKAMLALAKLPKNKYTPVIEQAIQRGIDFFFSVDPAEALYPSGWNDKPSGNWWKFAFPVFYVTDLLQILEMFAELHMLNDPRLNHALDIVRNKKDEQGKWPLEYSYQGKTWIDAGEMKQPNKWITLRVLRVLKAV